MLKIRFSMPLLTLIFFLFLQHINVYPNSQHERLFTKESDKNKVAVLIYNGALLLDYGIAAEMFLAADFMRSFEVFTVSDKDKVNLSIVGEVASNYTFDNAPQAEIIIVPGGAGWLIEAENPNTVDYLKKAQSNGSVLFSICTGSLLLAKAGLLREQRATTNIQAIKMLNRLDPSITVVKDRKYVESGNRVTSIGAGSAIEATLYLIERFTNPQVAEDLARRYLDYPYERSEYFEPKLSSKKDQK